MKWCFFLLLSGSVLAASYRPISTAQYAEDSRVQLYRALWECDQWLRQAAGPEHYPGWRRFLRMGDIESQLVTTRPSLKLLKNALNEWRRNGKGLEDPHFVSVQQSLWKFIRVRELLLQEPLAAAYANHKAQLNELLAQSPSEKVLRAIGYRLGWLELAGQDSDFIQEVRARFAHPNLAVRVSDALIGTLLRRVTVRQSKVYQGSAMGMQNEGIAYAAGRLSGRPVAGRAGVATLRVGLDANVLIPSLVSTKSTLLRVDTEVKAKAKTNAFVEISEDGVRVFKVRGTAKADPPLVNRIDGNPLAGLMAVLKINREEEQIVYESSISIATSVAESFRDSVKEQFANAELLTKIKQTLKFQGTYPRSVQFSSSDTQVEALALLQNAYQLGAPTGVPRRSSSADFSLSVHESAIGNYLEPYFGGKVDWDHQLFNVHKLLTLEEPVELRVHDNKPRWAMRMPFHAPVMATFQDGKVNLVWRAVGLEEFFGSQKYANSRPVEVDVSYVFRIEDGQPVGDRQGDVRVKYSTAEPESNTDTYLRTMFTKKMNAFFPETLEFGGLTIPKGSGWDHLNQLKLSDLSCHKGWLVLGYQLKK